MKNRIKYFLGIIIGTLALVSCEINDPINDISRTGNIATNVYMEIPSANVVAGNNVDFHTQYWSFDNEFKLLSIGYSIHANLNYSITAFATKYSYKLDSTQVSREYQEIKTFEHNASNFNKEKNAYVIDNNLPVSYTLAPTNIENMESYNQEMIDELFPASAIQKFYDGFFNTLDYELIKTLVVTNHSIVDEETFELSWDTETSENPNGGDPIETKTIKNDAIATLKGYVNQIPLKSIVYNNNKLIYEIGYTKSYQLKTRFKVVNGTGVENFSDEKTITVN